MSATPLASASREGGAAPAHPPTRLSPELRVALVGNPNCGKTALFNRLTGSRQKVANYAGVTVERKEGRLVSASGRAVLVIDLPGAYSLDAGSPDEAITADVVQGLRNDEPAPDLLIAVADATNLRLHLRFVLELRALGRPMVLALNMVDAAQRKGVHVDIAVLSAELGMPVVPTVAVRRNGAAELLALLDMRAAAASAPALAVSPCAVTSAAPSATPFAAPSAAPSAALSEVHPTDAAHRRQPAAFAARPQAVADRHAEVRRLLAVAVRAPNDAALRARDDAIDRVLLHPVAGLLILSLVMMLMFQAVFAGATPIMEGIKSTVAIAGDFLASNLPAGPLRSLLVDGLISGVGSVVVFLPQILILFAFILALEESGYLPRAAFLLDRLMAGVGLSGRSFIPLLSSFACAVPGVMATRSIPDARDRRVTILIAPLMTCSARLPVYALLIGAFVPVRELAGVFNLQGLVLFALYVIGVAGALAVAWVFKRGRQSVAAPLLMELPAYRMPHVRDLAIGLWERAHIFMRRVGTIILTATVLLWALSTWPSPPPGASEPAIYYSLAGLIGRALAVVFEPLGFNWQIAVALVPGMAAREVAVAALGTVYALSANGTSGTSGVNGGEVADQLLPVLASQWSLATGFALLAWYVFAPQCLSTLAVIRRETNSIRTMLFAAGYLIGLAYAAALITYHVARALGG